jgi:hypothetical protein
MNGWGGVTAAPFPNREEEEKMTQFPVFLYQCPGTWSGDGFTFGARLANDQGEFDAAVTDGWYPTVPQAVEAWRKPVQVSIPPAPVSVPDDDAPPTREEIEAKCADLGITVHHKHSDSTLLKKIDDALALLKETSDGLDEA